jgi:ribosomal protein S30
MRAGKARFQPEIPAKRAQRLVARREQLIRFPDLGPDL